jgi:hypothetical protein
MLSSDTSSVTTDIYKKKFRFFLINLEEEMVSFLIPFYLIAYPRMHKACIFGQIFSPVKSISLLP